MEISQPEKIYTNSLRHSIKLNRFSSNIMQSFNCLYGCGFLILLFLV